MISPLGRRTTRADALVEQPKPDALATLAALNAEFSVAEARISRKRMLRRLMVANVLVWIVIIAVVRLCFF